MWVTVLHVVVWFCIPVSLFRIGKLFVLCFSLFVMFKILFLYCFIRFVLLLHCLILRMFCSLFCVFFFYCFVYCFSLCIWRFLFCLCRVYGPLPPGENPIIFNKCRIISYARFFPNGLNEICHISKELIS
jgi:hypothetical protein